MIIYTWDIDLKLFEFLKNIFNKAKKQMNTIFITVKQTNICTITSNGTNKYMYHYWYVTGACFCTGINVNYHYTTGESHHTNKCQ